MKKKYDISSVPYRYRWAALQSDKVLAHFVVSELVKDWNKYQEEDTCCQYTKRSK